MENDYYFDDGVIRQDFLGTATSDLITNQDVGFNRIRFNLEGLVPINAPQYTAWLNTTVAGPYTINQKFQIVVSRALQFFTAGGTSIPRTIDDFVAQLVNRFEVPPPVGIESQISAAIVIAMSVRMGFVDTSSGIFLPNFGEWGLLSSVVPPLDYTTIAEQVFAEFVRTYPYNENGIIGDMLLPDFSASDDTSAYFNFFNNLGKFLTPIARLQNALVPGSDIDAESLVTYEEIYNSFFPGTPGDFQQKLVEFYEKKIQENGYFLPSHFVDDWIEDLQQELLSGPEGLLTLPFLTSVSGNNSEKVSVIDRILRLVSSLIETLQRVAATQAKQLDILTDLQQRYTQIQSQIPVITAGTLGLGTQIANITLEEDAEFRNNVNTNISQRAIETVRGRKQLEENKAKKVQSLINQANDAVNQQSEIATALLQQLSSLLQTIYR